MKAFIQKPERNLLLSGFYFVIQFITGAITLGAL